MKQSKLLKVLIRKYIISLIYVVFVFIISKEPIVELNVFISNFDRSSPLTLDKESKGFIDYSAAFYPTVKEKKIIPTDKNEVTEDKEPGNINVLDYRML